MMFSLSPSAWVHCPLPLPQAQFRLFCLPYAGGDASLFHVWPQFLPPDMRDRIEICPIQLPGRANRIREPLFTSVAALIDALVPSELTRSPLAPFLDKPFGFFGASLGGIIAFEIVRTLDARHQINASALCIAACGAPHLPGLYGVRGAERVTDTNLVEQIRAFGGTPEIILSNERLLRLILPKIRADSLMAATYAYTPDLSLDCPITVCSGIDDRLVSLADLAAWQVHTHHAFHMYTFVGDHFFVRDATPPVRVQFLESLVRSLPLPEYAPGLQRSLLEYERKPGIAESSACTRKKGENV
ncbi:MAG: thioesterase domain-containing protein [Ktedonobacteraceae bacterium]